MTRDRVKNEIAIAVSRGIRATAGTVVYKLAEQNVADVDVTSVDLLVTQVKVIFKNGPPRYFTVKLSENI